MVDKVGGRWLPIYPAMLAEDPLFASDPAKKEFGTMARTGILEGYAGPPNPLSGKVVDANVLTKTLQKILVDHISVADAVAWGQKQIEMLASGG